MTGTQNLDYIAEIVAELYNNDHVKNFVPLLSKGGRKRDPTAPFVPALNKWFKRGSGMNSNNSSKAKHTEEIHDIYNLRINYELTEITGKTPLDQLLRKAILSNVPIEKKITQNGMERDELKRAITIMRTQINTLIANNVNSQNDASLLQSQEYLSRLEDIYLERLEIGNFQEEKDFCSIALKALRILDKDDETSRKLYVLIAKKLGVTPRKIYTHTNERPRMAPRYESGLAHFTVFSPVPNSSQDIPHNNSHNNSGLAHFTVFCPIPDESKDTGSKIPELRTDDKTKKQETYSGTHNSYQKPHEGEPRQQNNSFRYSNNNDRNYNERNYRQGESHFSQTNHRNFVRNENGGQKYVHPNARANKAIDKVYDFPELPNTE
jgi:hypothetical protein